MKRRLRPGELFIDVGANVGYYTLLASRLVGNAGKVVAVEALPQTFSVLQSNIASNGLANVRCVNIRAAWNRSERLTIFLRHEGPTGTTSLMAAWAHRWSLHRQIVVDAEPLSRILSRDEIQRARLIKIDIEGAEWNVISEMTSWLSSTAHNLEIVIEISKSMLRMQHKSFATVLALFERFGFQAYRLNNDYLASTCVGGNAEGIASRITTWPNETVDQIDIVFSKVDSDRL